MGIKGLTTREAAFPQIGVLRKGAPKPERGPGRDLKHFRFDTDDRDAQALFAQAYGPEPTQVEVYLPYPTTEQNFQAWQELWVAGGLQHRCDGETCVRWRTPAGAYSEEPIPCPGGCKQVGRLRVILPALRRFAYVMCLTTSIHDIIALHENLLAIETMRGTLQGIPLLLSRKPREISMPGINGGKRQRVEKWLLTIEAKPDWVALQLASMERQALQLPAPAPLSTAARALTDSGHLDQETGEIHDGDYEEESSPPALPAAAADDDGIDFDARREPTPRQALEARLKAAHTAAEGNTSLVVPRLTRKQVDAMTDGQIELMIAELMRLMAVPGLA